MKDRYIILAALVILALGYYWGKRTATPMQVKVVQRDTLTITRVDTIKIDEPKPYKVEVIKEDTIYITQKDTIYITLPIESKEYKAEEYYAKISGYKPKLDFIEVYPRTEYKYITTTEKVFQKPKKWGLGVQIGAGIVIGEKVQMKPYLGVGLSYNFVSF